MPDPSSLPNCGSFFKNPEVSNSKLDSLMRYYPSVVYYKVDESRFKLSAAWLIEQCGLKGLKIGQVGTYCKQPLVIVNYGNASGAEIVNFARYIQRAVTTKFNVLLHPEVRII